GRAQPQGRPASHPAFALLRLDFRLARPAFALRAYGAASFACFATMDSSACRAEACEASEGWWSQAGSNRRPLACHASALPAELWPLNFARGANHRARQNPEHSSATIS